MRSFSETDMQAALRENQSKRCRLMRAATLPKNRGRRAELHQAVIELRLEYEAMSSAMMDLATPAAS